MAAIALAVGAKAAVGALGGGAFLAAVAGGVGAYFGGRIDDKLFGRKIPPIHHEGSRLTDLMVQSSTYGKAIPLVYGMVRIAGNLIWSRPIQEHVSTSTQTSGGKGGGRKVKSTTTTYTYTVSLAISICEGEISEVVRAWADSKQLDMTKGGGGDYSIYLGSESQMPDTYISSFYPPRQTPAYRGMAYVVIKNFPLESFGNRIPNFTFEVRRTLKKPYDLEDKIKDITLIPGASEYVYDTSLQEKIFGERDVAGNFVQGGKATTVNMNNSAGKTNVLVALDHLKTSLPNVEWVSLVVNWFANSADPSICKIMPGVEFNDPNARIIPDEWEVAGFSRSSAHKILMFDNLTPTYGGTPTDKSIVRLCQELRKRGYKVLFYPMLQVDTITPSAKPWRGRIKPTSTLAAETFFTRVHGYNAFIEHYASLSMNIDGNKISLKDNIDAFMIGSELVGLTSYMDPNGPKGIFPAATELKKLARTVKNAVGPEIKVMYGGDWSEYHSTNGWYNLDPLWSDPNIDAVAIDCYFPLTPDLPQSMIDYDAVYKGWTRDEGWDYYWNNTRTRKIRYHDQTYAWKNVGHWWNSIHTNPNGTTTDWKPKMKPLWFSELGFPSVDGCSNQPNVFIDPDSVESFYPRRSRGRVDFLAQRVALEASIDYLTDQNKLDQAFAPRKFVWTWDARPFPYFPDLLSVWSDGRNWKTGHWIQGKLGPSSLSAVVNDLLQKVGYDSTMYDSSSLRDIVSGFVITNRQTVRSCLEQLSSAYFFDMVESDGLLKFTKRGAASSSITTIDSTELVPGDEGLNTFAITRMQELELPRQVDVIYLNRESNYQMSTQIAQRQTVKSVDYVTVNLPIVLTDRCAKRLADVTLYNAWVGRINYQLTLPPRYAYLEPTDVITIVKRDSEYSNNSKDSSDSKNSNGNNDSKNSKDNKDSKSTTTHLKNTTTYLMRINSTKLLQNGMQEVTATAEDTSCYDFYSTAASQSSAHEQARISTTRLELLDLPAYHTDGVDGSYLYFAALSLGGDWNGAAIYRSDETYANYVHLQTIIEQAIIGTVLNVIPARTTYTWDSSSTIDVLLIFGELESASELAVLNGANACVIGDEVIQFQKAELIAPNKYRLSRLLRGRLGTEWAVTTHKAGDRFILLASAITREPVPTSSWGVSKKFKAVSVGSTIDSTLAQDFTYNARSLKPYSPVHIKGIRGASGDLTITWIRRTRTCGAWRDNVDVPIMEESERYEVDIMEGVEGRKVKRTISSLTSQLAVYTASDQVADFGTLQNSITVNVYQISAVVGRGYPGNASL